MIDDSRNYILIEMLAVQLSKSYGRMKGMAIKMINGRIYTSIVVCCKQYLTWKQNHPTDQLKLRELANNPIYYRSHSEDKVKVVENGEEIEYVGTIYSTTCTTVAFTEVKHPFQCFSCYDLEHNNSYTLLQKLNHSKSLKYLRTDVHRATRVHKYCSAENLYSALKHKVEEAKTQ